MNAITSVREKYQQLSDRMRREPGDSFSFASDFEEWWSRNGFKFGLAILLIAVLAVAIRMYFIKRRNAELCRTPVLFYQQMLSILRQKGLMRRPQVTPAEFVQEVGAQVSPAYRDCVSSLTDLFYKARYGNYLLSDAEQSSVRDSLRRLEQMQ